MTMKMLARASRSTTPRVAPRLHLVRCLSQAAPTTVVTSKAATSELKVELYEEGKLAKVSFNRPERMNALSFEMGDALLKLDKALEDSVLAVVLTGEGGRAFSTGRDLKDSKHHTKEQAASYMRLARDSVLATRAMSRPTIAAITGYAFGWGIEMSLACDLRVVQAESTLCLPETALGIFPGAMGTVLLPRIVGPAVARDLILTSRRFDGQEAFELGLANRVAKGAEQTVQTAMDLGAHISKMGPLGVKAARIVIDQGLDMSFKDHALLSDEHRFPLNDSEDFKEALAAFAEGRKPVFKGC